MDGRAVGASTTTRERWRISARASRDRRRSSSAHGGANRSPFALGYTGQGAHGGALVWSGGQRSWWERITLDEGKVTVSSKSLKFDPIEEARRQWIEHGWEDAALGMSVVTSIFRAQQIYLARIDAVLRPLALTFARFEVLSLLNFTRGGSMPMSKIGNRLQVHPTSVTNSVDRLESQGFVRRVRHATDRRTTLVEILPIGRDTLARATADLNHAVFSNFGVSPSDARQLFSIVRGLRLSEGDFE